MGSVAEQRVTLKMPAASKAALQALAVATGAPNLGALIQDATRTYEWLLAQQDAGHTIMVLTEADMRVLESTDLLDGARDTLAPLRQRQDA